MKTTITSLAFALFMLSGCGKVTFVNPTPFDLVSPTPTPTATTAPGALAISPATASVVVGATQTFTTTGGKAPVTFSVAAGTGTIVAATGVYTAPAAAGTATVRATDSLGATADATVTITATAVVPVAPVLTAFTNKVFPSTQVLTTGTLVLTSTDTANSGNTGDTFTCVFDNVVDGAVTATTACTTLPNSPTFTAGVLTWTPGPTAFGPYEMKITVTNSAGTASRLVVVDVQQVYSTTALVAYWDAQFATGIGQGVNGATMPTTTTTLTDLVGSTTGTLTGFPNPFLVTDGWAGNGATTGSGATGPYQLVLNGTSDYVDFGTFIDTAAYTSLSIEGWFNPANLLTPSLILFGNSDLGGHGINVLQSTATPNTLDVVLGDTSGATIICTSADLTGISQVGGWYHIAATVADGGTVTLYVNGDTLTNGCNVSAGAYTIAGGGAPFRIGADSTASNLFAGSWSDLRVYNSELSAATVLANFNATRGRFGY